MMHDLYNVAKSAAAFAAFLTISLSANATSFAQDFDANWKIEQPVTQHSWEAGNNADIDPMITASITPNIIRGVVRSPIEIELLTKLDSQISLAPFRDGMTFKKGELLVRFNCTQLEAERLSAQASLDAAKVELGGKQHLHKHGAAGASEARLAKAHVDKAQAELQIIATRSRDCQIKAPFDGRVIQSSVSVHERPVTNKPLMTIVDDTQLEIELVLPSLWLKHAKPGMTFSFTLDETGTTHEAKIERFGATVDAVSQTISAIAVFVQPPDLVLVGMSGNAEFEF